MMHRLKRRLSRWAQSVKAKLRSPRFPPTPEASSIRGSISSPSNPRLWSTRQAERLTTTFRRPLPFEPVLEVIREELSVEAVESDSTIAVEAKNMQSTESLFGDYSDSNSCESVISTPSKAVRKPTTVNLRGKATASNQGIPRAIFSNSPIPVKSLAPSYNSNYPFNTPTKLGRKDGSANLRQRALTANAVVFNDVWFELAMSEKSAKKTPGRVSSATKDFCDTPTKLGKKIISMNLHQFAVTQDEVDFGDIWIDIAVSLKRLNGTPVRRTPKYLPAKYLSDTPPCLGTRKTSMDLRQCMGEPGKIDIDDICINSKVSMKSLNETFGPVKKVPKRPVDTPKLERKSISIKSRQCVVTSDSPASDIIDTSPDTTTDSIDWALDAQDFLPHRSVSSPTKVGRNGSRMSLLRSPVKTDQGTPQPEALPQCPQSPDAKKIASPTKSRHRFNLTSESGSSHSAPHHSKKRGALKDGLKKMLSAFAEAQVEFWDYAGVGLEVFAL